MADLFISTDVRKIFKEKIVLFLGDSIMRNLYQDFVYLVEKGDLTPNAFLKKKGVQVWKEEEQITWVLRNVSTV